MFSYSLSHCFIDYNIILNSPIHIGGAIRNLYKRTPSTGDKSRGPDYVLSPTGQSDVHLPVFLPLRNQRGEYWEFLIPTTTIRGLLRHYCYTFIEDILKEVGINLENPWKDDGIFGNILIRHAFGTTSQKGIITFYPARNINHPANPNTATYSDITRQDLRETPERNLPIRLITQNKLDRITMATTEGLRSIGAIDTGTILHGSFELINFPWWAIGLLGVAIAAINRGDLNIGAKTGIGFGKVKMEIKKVLLTYHRRLTLDKKDPRNLPGVGYILKELKLEYEYLKASFAESIGNKSNRIEDQQPPPLFLLPKDDIITEEVEEEENINPFEGKILEVKNINHFFSKAISKIKEAIETLP